jgi:hypothetical protein
MSDFNDDMIVSEDMTLYRQYLGLKKNNETRKRLMRTINNSQYRNVQLSSEALTPYSIPTLFINEWSEICR